MISSSADHDEHVLGNGLGNWPAAGFGLWNQGLLEALQCLGSSHHVAHVQCSLRPASSMVLVIKGAEVQAFMLPLAADSASPCDI